MEQFNDNEILASSRSNAEHEWDRAPGSSPIKAKLAHGLRSAAASLERNGPQYGEMSGYVRKASRWLDNAGDYVEDLNPTQVKSDIQRQMRTNPGRSLLIAGAVGLIVGTLFRRR